MMSFALWAVWFYTFVNINDFSKNAVIFPVVLSNFKVTFLFPEL